MTNADKIRAMSDDVLAEFICHRIDDCCVCVYGKYDSTGISCGIKDWLKQEAEDESDV